MPQVTNAAAGKPINALPDYGSDDDIYALETKYGIPRGLYLKLLESGERSGQDAVSPKGAIGRAQLMPDTAKELGVDPTDPRQNLDGGARYLRKMYDRFGDWGQSVGHYNSGPGGNLTNPETKKYMERVMGTGGVPSAGTGGAADALAARMLNDPARKSALKDIQSAEDQYQRDEPSLKKSIADSSAEIDRITAEMGKIKPPEAPSLPTLPPPPKEIQTDPTRVLRQFMPVVAALAGFKTRAPAIAVMNAMAAAAEAARNNDNETLKRQHEVFQDKMGELRQQWEMERDRYLDIFNNDKMAMDEKLAELRSVALRNENQQMLHSIDSGDLGMAYQHLQVMDSSMINPMRISMEAERNDLERKRLDAEDQWHKAMIDYDYAKVPPATQAYDEAYKQNYAAARGQGMDDATARTKAREAASTAAGEVAQRVSMGAQKTIFNEEQKYREKLVGKGSPGEQYQALKTNLAKIKEAAANPEQFISPSGTAIVADTFTRAFNGGFAIRGYQAKMLQEDRSLANSAKTFIQRFHNGGRFTPQEIKQMAQAVINEEPELRENFVGAANDAIKDGISYGLTPQRMLPPGLRDVTGLDWTGGGETAPAAAGGATPAGGASTRIPEAAISELKANPSAEMRRHFDEAFGDGAAEAALGG